MKSKLETMSAINGLYRSAYRLAYPVWLSYLRLMRIQTQGAQVAIWSDNRVLLIRNSYRQTFTFPGGYIRKGESSATAASRELREETGIPVLENELSYSFSWTHAGSGLRARDDIYECRLDPRPTLSIDNREVIEALFLAPAGALALPLESHVRFYLSNNHPDCKPSGNFSPSPF